MLPLRAGVYKEGIVYRDVSPSRVATAEALVHRRTRRLPFSHDIWPDEHGS